MWIHKLAIELNRNQNLLSGRLQPRHENFTTHHRASEHQLVHDLTLLIKDCDPTNFFMHVHSNTYHILFSSSEFNGGLQAASFYRISKSVWKPTGEKPSLGEDIIWTKRAPSISH